MMSKGSKTMRAETRDVAIRGGKSLSVRVWGSLKKAARPQEHWIALHGHGDDSDTLDNHIAPLVLNHGAAAIVCIDMLTHDETPSVLAADVLALADALGWGRFSILSHTPEAALVSQLVAARATDRIAVVCPLESHHAHLTDPAAIERAVNEELAFEDEEEDLRAHPAPHVLSALADVYFALCPKEKFAAAHIVRELDPWSEVTYRDVSFARTMGMFEAI